MKNVLISVFATTFVWCISFTANAQYVPKKNKKDYFVTGKQKEALYKWTYDNYEKLGVHFSVGATYTLTPFQPQRQEYEINNSSSAIGDTLLQAKIKAKGRPGIYGEIGMVHIARKPNKILHYIDWGVGAKYYGGAEITEAELYRKEKLIKELYGEGQFYTGYIHLRASAHNLIQLSSTLFIDNALGVNVDFAVLPKSSSYDGFHAVEREKFQGQTSAQIHYSFGLGYKPYLNKGYFFIPSIQVPVMGFAQGEPGVSPRFNWFSSKYYPLILQAKFVWLLKKPPHRCPPVYNNSMDRELMRQQH